MNALNFDFKEDMLTSLTSKKQTEDDLDENYNYEQPIQYWLLVIGYAMGYGSFWRFPYLIYTCG